MFDASDFQGESDEDMIDMLVGSVVAGTMAPKGQPTIDSRELTLAIKAEILRRMAKQEPSK